MVKIPPDTLRDWDSYSNLVVTPDCIAYLHVAHKKTFEDIGRLLGINKNTAHNKFRNGGYTHQAYNLYDAALDDTRFIKNPFQRLEAQRWLRENCLVMLHRFSGETSMSARQEKNLAEKETSGAGDWRLDLDDKATVHSEPSLNDYSNLCQLLTVQLLARVSISEIARVA